MAEYSIADAKNNFPKLVDRALAGEEVKITRRGKTVARLIGERPPTVEVDLEWLDKVRVKLSDPTLNFTDVIRAMRDGGY